jgi:hypothetical protein
MPFVKITKGKNKGKYKSPSGRIFTEKQVKLYYASGGFDKTKLAKMELLKGMRGEQS